MDVDPMETHVEKLDTLDTDVSNIKNRLTGLETRQEAQGLVQQQILTKIDGLTDAVSGISSQKGMVSSGFIVSVVAVLISAVTVILGGGAFFHNALAREIKENEMDVRELERAENIIARSVAVNEQRLSRVEDDILHHQRTLDHPQRQTYKLEDLEKKIDQIDQHGSRRWIGKDSENYRNIKEY